MRKKAVMALFRLEQIAYGGEMPDVTLTFKQVKTLII